MNRIEDEKYIKAKEKVAELKSFYGGLVSYTLVISFLGAINYYQNEWEYAWFLWAAFGWGIGLVFQAIKAFGLNPFFNNDWEKRKIKEFMQKEDAKKRWE